MVLNVQIHAKFLSFRISIFNTIFVDYAGICFRTLGQGIGIVEQSTWDLLSYAAACFLITCMVMELLYIYEKVNSIHLKDEEQRTNSEKVIASVFYEGILEERVKVNWFSRNYQLMYLIRYFTMMLCIFNLQTLDAAQVNGCQFINIFFAVLTYYHQLSLGLFESKCEAVFKLIQETSMSVMIILVNIFCVDSFKHFLPNKAKQHLVIIFLTFFILNIGLEIIMAIMGVGEALWELKDCCKKKSKVEPKPKSETVSESNRVDKKLERRGSQSNNSLLDSKLNEEGEEEKVLDSPALFSKYRMKKRKGRNSIKGSFNPFARFRRESVRKRRDKSRFHRRENKEKQVLNPKAEKRRSHMINEN